MNFIKKVGKIALVDLLWILFSIPLVTMGAATCAAYYVCLKIAENKEVQIWQMFVKAFKGNFKQGTFMWIITLIGVAGVIYTWTYVRLNDVSKVVIIGAVLLTLIVVVINLYTYPMIARYENSLKNIIKNASVLCIQYSTKTLPLIFILAAEFTVACINKYTMIATFPVVYIAVIYTISVFAAKIFKDIESR